MPNDKYNMVYRNNNRFNTNVFSNLVYLLVSSFFGFFLVPYYIKNLNIGAYAIIPLSTSLSAFVILISESVNTSVQRHITIAIQQNDINKVKILFNTSLVTTFYLALLFVPVSIAISLIASTEVEIPGISSQSLFLVILILLLIALFTSWCCNFTNILFAKNRLYLINTIKLMQIFIQFGVLYLFFTIGFTTLTSVVVSYAISVIAYFLGLLCCIYRIYPISVSYRYYKSSELKDIYGLGLWNIINSLGNILFLETSLIIANFMLGLTVGGHFSLCTKVTSIVIMIGAAISYSFSPYLYGLYSKRETQKIKKVGIISVKTVGISVSVFISILIIYSKELIEIWVGPGFEDIYSSLEIMLSALALSCFVMPTYCISVMQLKMKIPSIVTLVLGVLNVGLAVVLVSYSNTGMVGIALAWAVTIMFKNCVFNPVYHSRLLFGNYHGFFIPHLIVIGVFIISILFNYCIYQMVSPVSLAGALILSAICSVSITGVLLRRELHDIVSTEMIP